MTVRSIPEKLRRVVEAHEYPFGIAAGSDGSVVGTAGAADALGPDDLRMALFGDAHAIARLCASFDGQLLPRIWSQGSVRCAVHRPAPDVVGLFVDSEKSNVQLDREFSALRDDLG